MVDDNRDGVIARRSVLEELGYKVISAGCGGDALKLLDEHDFDLVVTDFRMEPMDGLELIKALRGRDFVKPIILLSGFAEALGLRADAIGADAVVQKSANEVANLLRHTKRLLNTPKKPAASQAGSDGKPTRARGNSSGS